MAVVDGGYRGRRVLVTGGAGFIGQNLVARLLAEGAEVTVFDYALSRELDELARSRRGALQLLQGDIRDEAKVEDAVRGQQVIFDLAGKSGAADSNRAPLLDLEVNCRGHLTVFESCRRLSPQAALVFPSSRLVYGKPQRLPVDEQHPLAPESFYAVHKLAVEHYLQIYARLHGIRSTILRISNPYGPRQGRDARIYGVVNKFVQAAVRDETITLFGDGAQRRDYLHIDDLVEALLAAGLRAAVPSLLVNIGGAEAVSLQNLASRTIALAGAGRIEHIPWPDDYRQVETGDYLTDLTWAAEQLDWQPQVELDAGLRETIAYYRGC
jgi:UDP-glucose 4-epimerase